MMSRHPTDRIHRMNCRCADCSALYAYRLRRRERDRSPRSRVRVAMIGLLAGALLASAYAAYAEQPSLIDLTIGARS